MSFFKRHVFICNNTRTNGRQSCGDCNADAMMDYMRGQAKSMGLIGEGKNRISKAGCLGRCEVGPVMVVYPEATWYTYVDEADVQEILDQHLAQGNIVSRLLVDPQ